MNTWQKQFGIDCRSLILFRVGLALLILADLFMRLQDLTAHYTDSGILPRHDLIAHFLGRSEFSFHLISGTWGGQLILFAIQAIFALFLLVGYHTRVATILSWVFLCSLQTRNPLILNGGDFVLRMLLFFAMFIPLDRKNSPPVVSFATFGLLLQVCFIYWFSAALKSDSSWRQEGTAVWYALNVEQFTTPLGLALLNYPRLLKVFTFATFYLEAFGPFFAFSPIFTAPLRLATAATFIIFHLVGLNLTMDLALFPYVCALAWVVFIPGFFWDKVWPMEKTCLPYKTGKLTNSIAAFFIVYIFLWNLNTLGVKTFSFTPKMYALGTFFRVDQYWGMFAPYPVKESGWYVIPAILLDGEEVDLYRDGAPLDWKAPPLISATYANVRWKKYLMNLPFGAKNEINKSLYANYLRRQWNGRHVEDKQILTLEIVFMMKIISLKNPVLFHTKNVLWRQEG